MGLGALPAFGQNIVSNPGFETPPAGESFVNRSGPGAMGAWDVGGNIDHIGGFWAAAEGAQSVDLNGSGPGSVQQSLTTIPGRRYRIRYALSENFYGYGDKTMNVRWDGAVVEMATLAHDPARTPQNMLWVYREVSVVASGSASVLEFESTTGAMDGSLGVTTYYGPALDDVSVIGVECCPADFNCDAAVNSQDFFDFLGAFFSTSESADFNADMVVNSQDFFDFLAAFFAGC
jgi:choice-of-anchor C domain-containing protein